ncbi:MAG: SDR family oxidoreductase [Eubacterium sp.]|nr:SDR family oxidoreductase [Eubacterium sp.]
MAGHNLLAEKTAILTGAGSGIGAACARRMAEEGAKGLCLVDLNEAAAEAVAKEIEEKYGCKCITVQADVSSEDDVKRVFEEFGKTFERLDVMLNCAGIGKIVPVEEMTCKGWDLTMAVNVRSVFLFSREAIRIMSPQKEGRIINMASQAGKTGGLMIGMDYAASKAGVLNITKSLAKYAAKSNITVNSVAPGLVATAMTTEFGYKNDMVPLGRIATPEEIADVVVFLGSDLSRYMTGACVDVNGGILMD